jgi:hypothetical protein
MERKRNGPALVQEGAGLRQLDPYPLAESHNHSKPLGYCLSSLFASWNRERREDMPGRIDGAWLCEKPLELYWADVDMLGDCWWSLWIANVDRVLVEDEALAEYLITKLRDEGVLDRLPEIRVRGGDDG